MAETGLFSNDLISPEVASALPEGYNIRALRRSDYNTGFLDCLRVLTTVGDISEAAFDERYKWMVSQEGYYILVIEDSSSGKSVVVGTGALLVERKL
jgi:glucosamine-phosphate N-acetyltransferase